MNVTVRVSPSPSFSITVRGEVTVPVGGVAMILSTTICAMVTVPGGAVPVATTGGWAGFGEANTLSPVGRLTFMCMCPV